MGVALKPRKCTANMVLRTLLTHHYRVVTAAPQLGSVQTALTVPV